MTAAMTYDTLVEDVRGWLERPNDAALELKLPTLVMLAENRVAAEMKMLGTQQVVAGALTTGEPTLAKPSYWRDSVSFTIVLANGETKQLYLRTYEYCRTFWPNDSVNDEPRFYADYNYDNFFIVPTPDADYVLELQYHARVAPLDASNQTNWFTLNAPQALLYATLYEAQLWLKNYAQADEWLGRYDRVLTALVGEDRQRDSDRSEQKKS